MRREREVLVHAPISNGDHLTTARSSRIYIRVMKRASNDNPLPRLMSAKKAAEELGIPYTSLRDAHFRGLIPVIKIGSTGRHARWYFDRKDLEALVVKLKEQG